MVDVCFLKLQHLIPNHDIQRTKSSELLYLTTNANYLTDFVCQTLYRNIWSLMTVRLRGNKMLRVTATTK